MQDLVKHYHQNKYLIKNFIISSIRQLDIQKGYTSQHLFEVFPSLELIYETNTKLEQTTSNIYRKNEDNHVINSDRSYLVTDHNKELSFHDPYISTATGKLCITLVVKTSAGYLFLDFRLRTLLERFDLIVPQKGFYRFNKYAYIFMASSLIFFGLFVSFYGLYSFVAYFFEEHALSLDIVFKPVIAITLGIAVYDLGRTILEHEVLPKTQNAHGNLKIKTLTNFLISIIIALLIEALLIVFKISIKDYTQMHYAAFLIISLAMLLYVFSRFSHPQKRS